MHNYLQITVNLWGHSSDLDDSEYYLCYDLQMLR